MPKVAAKAADRIVLLKFSATNVEHRFLDSKLKLFITVWSLMPKALHHQSLQQ